MKTKQVLCFILALILTAACFTLPADTGAPVTSAADEVIELTAEDFEYAIYSDEITIVGYNASHKRIKIPDTINGSPVTAIEGNAFGDNKALEYVELPATLSYFAPGVFDASMNLKELSIPANNNYYTCADGVLYNKNKTAIVCYPAAKAGKFTIPESVTTIEDMAFLYCHALTSVNMYNNVTTIGSHAFEGCWSMTDIRLSDNLQTIGYRALSNCRSLEEIHIPYSVKAIGKQAFLGGIDSSDNWFYYFTKGIYYVKGSYAEKYVKTLHVPTEYIKAETRTITDVATNTVLYDSEGVFPKTGALDLKVTVEPDSKYTPLLPVRYSDMAAYTVTLLHNGKAISLAKPVVVRFNSFPKGTIPTATKVYIPVGNSLIEKTRAPQAAFVGTSFASTETFVVITNNDFSLKGDIDGDGIHSVYDVRIAIALSNKLVALTPAQLTAAEADGKAGATMEDAYEILRYAAGIK
ncbi:MAG: leucine-rich repeat protein [Clostridia bacterium]|nr:leucine-rich repeat protein [Clostridia bacterium]